MIYLVDNDIAFETTTDTNEDEDECFLTQKVGFEHVYPGEVSVQSTYCASTVDPNYFFAFF